MDERLLECPVCGVLAGVHAEWCAPRLIARMRRAEAEVETLSRLLNLPGKQTTLQRLRRRKVIAERERARR